MKKFLSVIMSVVMAVMGTSCGAGSDAPAAEETSAAETSQAAVSETEQTTVSEETEMTISRPELTKDMKLIALTFDDGPNLTTTNSVIDKLEKYSIVGSFFVIGNNITGNESEGTARVMKRAHDMGCEINSHSQTHSDMTKLTEDEITAEIEFTSQKIEEITGEAPKFFRPPYIAVNQTMFDTIDMPFIAGVGAEDWLDSVTADMRAQKILDQARDGGIILLHDAQGNTMTVEALDTIIPTLLDEGYTFVTVSELFAAKEVEPAKGIVYSNSDQTTMYGS